MTATSPRPPSEDLQSKVTKWLNAEGYPLEFRTAVAFARAGFSVRMGTFIVSREGKLRDIDVEADYKFNPTKATFEDIRKLRILIECKYSPDPVIVLQGFNRPAGVFDMLAWAVTQRLRVVMSATGATFDHSLVERLERPPAGEAGMAQIPWMSPECPIGHGIVTAFRGGNSPDRAYEAVAKMANAAHDYCATVERSDMAPLMAMLPCVVVQAPLLISKFDASSGNLWAEPIAAARILCGAGEGKQTMVVVVQADAVDHLAQTAALGLGVLGGAINDLVDAYSP